MGIAQSVASWLISNGHDAVHLNDESLFELDDDRILQKAIKENRIVLTTDTDFSQILALGKIANAAVIQFRTSVFTPTNIKDKLELLFNDFQTQLDEYFILTIEDTRMRYRKCLIRTMSYMKFV